MSRALEEDHDLNESQEREPKKEENDLHTQEEEKAFDE